MQFRILIISVLTIAFNLSNAFAQAPIVKAELSKDSIVVGEQVKLRLECSFPKGASVMWPAFSDTLAENVEIVSRSAFDTVINASGKSFVLGQNIFITSFDSGAYFIPPIQFSYYLNNDTSTAEYFETLPLSLAVDFIPVDTSLAIKDIKEPLESPFTWREILPWVLRVLAVLALIAIVAFIVYRIKNKKPILSFNTSKIPEPHIEALKELEKLKQRGLWQQGKVKEYYTALTDILRKYIAGRFGIQAAEMTSHEIIEEAGKNQISDDNVSLLAEIFTLADLAKFAKAQPLPGENDNSMSNAFAFVNGTKPIEIPLGHNVKNNNVDENAQ